MTAIRPRRWWVGGTAAAGVAAAHVLAYVLAEPGSHQRAELLASTGHRFWAVAVAVALGLFAAGMAGFVSGRVRTPHPPSGPQLVAELAPRLALLQVAGFLALEAVERASTGHTLTSLFVEPVVVIGIAVQMAMAVVAAVLLALFGRVVDRVVTAIRRRRAGSGRTFRPALHPALVPAAPGVATGGRGLRGPPPGL